MQQLVRSELLHLAQFVCAVQGRDRGIGVSQSKIWGDDGNFTCFGGRRWDEYRRRNIRTYSSTSREAWHYWLSGSRILPGTTMHGRAALRPHRHHIEEADRGVLTMAVAGTGAVVAPESGHSRHTGQVKTPTKPRVSTDSQSVSSSSGTLPRQGD